MSTTLEPTSPPSPAPDLAPLENPAVFEAHLATQADLPAWLIEQKRTAWARYRDLPMPNRLIESWRFGNLRGLADFGQFAPADTTIDDDTVTALVARSENIENVSGRIVLADDQVIASEVSELAIEAGATIKGNLL